MRRQIRQSAPPEPYDIYRGLPMGPGGVEPLFFGDAPGGRFTERRRSAIPLGAMVDRFRRWLKSTTLKLHHPQVGEGSPTAAKGRS